MDEGSKVVRVRQRPADPWEALAEATLTRDGPGARGAWRRIRARFLLPLDAALLALDAKRELDAATMAQLSEYAGDGAR